MLNPALIKPAISLITGACTSRVVGQVIRNNVTTVTTLDKIQVMVAGAALGSLAGTAASRALIEEIETVEATVKAFKEGTKTE